MERENGRSEQPIKGLLDRYDSPQTRHFAHDVPSQIKTENGHNKHLLNNTAMERENGHNEEIEGVLFRLVHHSNRHLVMAYPDEITRIPDKSDYFTRMVPTENLLFPELEASFSADKWNNDVVAQLRVDFFKGWVKRRWGKYVEDIHESTLISLFAGYPDKFRTFSIYYSAASTHPREMNYSPPTSLDKWQSVEGIFTRPLEFKDLQSFWKSAESVLKEVDPEFLQYLEKNIKIISSHRLSTG